MENKDIVNNEEIMDVIEVAEDYVPARNLNGWKIVGAVGAVIAVGGLAYMYIVKPIVKKAKAVKADKQEYEELVAEELHAEEVLDFEEKIEEE